MSEIDESPCEHCPSAKWRHDEESLMFKACIKSGELAEEDVLFPCAWRPWRICKGLYDFIHSDDMEDE